MGTPDADIGLDELICTKDWCCAVPADPILCPVLRAANIAAAAAAIASG